MAKIVIYTSGTLGDHLPFIALSEALTQRGHRPLLVINQAMHKYAHQAGLEAVALTDIERGPEQARENAWAWDHWGNRDPGAHPKAKPFDLAQHITQARELIDLCHEADLLISVSIRPLGYIAHTALNIPWLTVSMNPYSFWQSVIGRERLAVRESMLREYDALGEIITDTFSALGINKTIPPWHKGWYWAKNVLLASSRHFSRPNLDQLQPHNRVDMTGFWVYQHPDWATWQPNETLHQFCEQRPIVLAFSSQPLEDPTQILAIHARAAAQLNMPLLVVRGWAGFSAADLPPDVDPAAVMFADFSPYDWLFTQAACTIQHGGIGSIATAIRQGCPLLVEPFGNDQLYNASRVANLGVGIAMHPHQLTAEGLAKVLREQVLTPERRTRAEEIGAKLNAENGVETACDLIETYLERQSAITKVTRRSGEAERRGDTRVIASSPPPISGSFAAPHTESLFGQTQTPKIIHQTWKNAYPPPEMIGYKESWQIYHPDWQYFFWTDEDLRAFIEARYAWFLPVYDSYPEPIMRVDAARYFILFHYGGICADLDCECLRPLDPLLAGKQLLLGLEPYEHEKIHFPAGKPFEHIVCNALMVSMPGHPFWDHLFVQLMTYHRAPDPLNATGPFLLTRAYESFPHRESITIIPPEQFYPVSSITPWAELSPEAQTQVAQTAYAIHHWWGSWWRKNAKKQARQVKASLLVAGETISVSAFDLDRSLKLLDQFKPPPRVSCLMVTQNRAALTQRAIRCFQRQTYPNKELIIVDDGESDSLSQWIDQLEDERIVLVRLPAEGKPLGELRNLAVARAGGDYVAQWDDDDLSDPQRLSYQMAVVIAQQTQACFLERQQLWWPQQRRWAVSTRRVWEGSFLCAKEVLPAYPAQPQGEDTPVIEQLINSVRAVVLDAPWLYTYVFHGDNTFNAAHWESHWHAATETAEGELYTLKLVEMEEQLGLELSGVRSQESGVSRRPSAVSSQPSATKTEVEYPEILILCPVKDAARYLPRFWDNLASLSYPHDKISLAFLESDSIDHTYSLIEENLPALRAEFARAKLFKQDYGYRSALPRWEPGQQYQRRSIMAKSRNQLLARALEDEDWVLWIDVDVARWPNDVIEQLLAANKEILVPNCLSLDTGETFDYNTFKLAPDAGRLDWSPYILDGILQPPKGFGRLYLSDMQEHHLVEVDGVGGTMLLIQAGIHREGLVFPTFSYKHHIETEGLALLAKDMGYTCWGLPNLEIFHP